MCFPLQGINNKWPINNGTLQGVLPIPQIWPTGTIKNFSVGDSFGRICIFYDYAPGTLVKVGMSSHKYTQGWKFVHGM